MPTTAVIAHEVAAAVTTTQHEPSDDVMTYEMLSDVPEWSDPAVTLPQLDARLLGRRPPPQAHRADLINTAVDCVCGILQSVGQSGTGIGYVQKA